MSSNVSSIGVARSGADPPPLTDVGAWLTDAWITAASGSAGLGIEQSETPDGSVTVRVLGDLDLASSPELRAILDRLAATTQPTILDLSATGFMDCSGLSVVLHAARTAHAGDWSFTVARERSPAVTRLIDFANVGAALSHDGTPEHHTRDGRSQTTGLREDNATRRDAAAAERDMAANARDRIAAEIDGELELLEHERATDNAVHVRAGADLMRRAADDRRRAASGRARAAEHREAAASDRQQAADDREQAASDRRAASDALMRELRT